MLFNSYEFIFLFLPLTFFLYFYLNSKRLILASKSFLVFASLFFYSYWNPIYLPIILSSMIFNYAIGSSLEKEIKHLNKRALLIISGFYDLTYLPNISNKLELFTNPTHISKDGMKYITDILINRDKRYFITKDNFNHEIFKKFK